MIGKAFSLFHTPKEHTLDATKLTAGMTFLGHMKSVQMTIDLDGKYAFLCHIRGIVLKLYLIHALIVHVLQGVGTTVLQKAIATMLCSGRESADVVVTALPIVTKRFANLNAT